MPYYRSAEKSTMDFGGRQIALYQWGQGDETVLLVHGWGSRATRLGHLAEPLNQRGFRVAAVDLPAQGDSEGKMTNLLEIVELLAQLHGRFAPVRAIIGHSFGGMATAAALHRHKLEVARVVLIAAPFSMEFIFQTFCDNMNLTPKVRERLITTIVERFEKTRQVHVFDFSPARLVDSLHIPVMVIHDRDDREVAYEQGVGYGDNLPNASFVSTQGLGHRRILNDESVIQAAVGFIAE